jgi:hypothetical protein
MTAPLDVYDSEMVRILEVQEKLQLRARFGGPRNYSDFEREIRERFEDIGFTVDVNWHSYAMNHVVQAGSAMPEITITGRTDPGFVFDPDQQVHEVTSNVLDLPEEDAGVIATDQGESFRRFREGQHDHGHGHSH